MIIYTTTNNEYGIINIEERMTTFSEVVYNIITHISHHICKEVFKIVLNFIQDSKDNIYLIDMIRDLFPNIIILDLNFNNIVDISMLKNLRHIECLKLGYNNITDISVLKYLPNLEILHLYNNNITDISSLKNLTNLKELHLRNNNLDITSDESINILQEIINNNINLVEINLFNNIIDIEKLELLNLEKLLNLEEFKIVISYLHLISKNNPDHPIIQSYDFKTILNNDNNLYNTLIQDLNMHPDDDIEIHNNIKHIHLHICW